MTLQSSNIQGSLSPSDKKMFMLFDGAIAGGLRSLYEESLDVCPLMVLKDGVFDGVSALGPMIADFGASIVLKELWAKNHPLVARASVLHTSYDESALLDFMRFRVQVMMPEGHAVWLRIGDAKVVSRLAGVDGRLPAHFWSGINSIFFRSSDGSMTQYRPSPSRTSDEQKEGQFASNLVAPCFQFSLDLLAALDSSADHQHRDVL
ncbi:DUF4123 domain-containing protein [Marinobacter sp. bablab_jr008]|uniref:DUF4123 domain-containing protein n=1 Tax=Marinobacter sp. bablab_jr008 TaxID=2755064 RepID=UPI0018F1F9BE|nr:DUF4123 domain-containing protein [Marinobacter sp. bablab_jr008]MEC9038172.1 DUF4123 domain-containing protein [Pseudomonadota bacterium]